MTRDLLDTIVKYSHTLSKPEFVKTLNNLTEEDKEYVVKNMTAPLDGEYNNMQWECE